MGTVAATVAKAVAFAMCRLMSPRMPGAVNGIINLSEPPLPVGGRLSAIAAMGHAPGV
jgi:hypothetical protein